MGYVFYSQNTSCGGQYEVCRDQVATNSSIKMDSSCILNLGSSERVTTIRSNMQVDEVMRHLVQHGCRNITDELDLNCMGGHPIAWGGSGLIYLAQLRNGTNVAVKCLESWKNLDSSEASMSSLKHAAREIYAWSKCTHPMILRLYGIAQVEGRLAIISPWMQKGNLRGFLRTRVSFDRIQMCLQLVSALQCMHVRGIVHGDIKPDNVVMSDENTPLFTDFGNALLTYEATLQFTATTSLPTSLRYAAPEILDGSSGYSVEADIYAFGMMVLEILTGKVPFAKMRDIAVLHTVTTAKKIPDRPELLPLVKDTTLGDKLWALLVQCWAYEPQKRPSATVLEQQLATIFKRREDE